MNRWVTLKKLFYLTFISIIILICLEILANIYLSKVMEKSTKQKFRFNSYRVYEHCPGFREGNNDRDWIVINRNGFRRTEEVLRTKAKNTFRAFLLGGSAAHGISSVPPYPVRHIQQDETIDACLEKMLSEKYPAYNIEIINAAVTGYHVFLHTQYILTELLDYDPDLIIFFDGANDHYTNNPEYNPYRDFCYQFWKSRLQDSSIKGMFDYFIMYLSRRSALARGYFAWKLQKNASGNIKKIDLHKHYKNKNRRIFAHKRAAKKQFLRSIDINLLVLRDFDIDSVVCLQPMLVLRDKELLSQAEIGFLHEDDNVRTLYPTVWDEVNSVTGRHQVRFIDMVPVFNSERHKGEQLFIDYCHLSPEGSKLAAQALLPEVEAILKERLSGKE